MSVLRDRVAGPVEGGRGSYEWSARRTHPRRGEPAHRRSRAASLRPRRRRRLDPWSLPRGAVVSLARRTTRAAIALRPRTSRAGCLSATRRHPVRATHSPGSAPRAPTSVCHVRAVALRPIQKLSSAVVDWHDLESRVRELGDGVAHVDRGRQRFRQRSPWTVANPVQTCCMPTVESSMCGFCRGTSTHTSNTSGRHRSTVTSGRGSGSVRSNS